MAVRGHGIEGVFVLAVLGVVVPGSGKAVQRVLPVIPLVLHMVNIKLRIVLPAVMVLQLQRPSDADFRAVALPLERRLRAFQLLGHNGLLPHVTGIAKLRAPVMPDNPLGHITVHLVGFETKGLVFRRVVVFQNHILGHAAVFRHKGCHQVFPAPVLIGIGRRIVHGCLVFSAGLLRLLGAGQHKLFAPVLLLKEIHDALGLEPSADKGEIRLVELAGIFAFLVGTIARNTNLGAYVKITENVLDDFQPAFFRNMRERVYRVRSCRRGISTI